MNDNNFFDDDNINNINLNILNLAEAFSHLSGRESEVLKKIIDKKKNIEIADELSISKKTVENHITNICKKLKMNKRGMLRNWANRQTPIS